MNKTIKLDHAWHTDLSGAVAEAKRRNLPILSLRLLGRLDEELSCANSRFFRKWLYPNPRLKAVLAKGFVMHWRSVRPVPVVTIDFGDGRQLIRTLTGNSAHLVLDHNGRPVDAIPGMYSPQGFEDALTWSWKLARSTSAETGQKRADLLARAHAAELRRPARLRLPLPPPAPARNSARSAGMLAGTKMGVERPMLDQIDGLTSTIVKDEAFNESVLHRQIHGRFAAGVVDNEATLTSWLYNDVFQMPEHDPWLGLIAGDAAIENDVTRER